MDRDQSGKIDAAEFANALKKMGVGSATPEVVKSVMASADPDGDGKLDYKVRAVVP